MTDKAPAVHIPEEHQSAPKEHYADRAIREAAAEFHEHKWSPDSMDEQAKAAQSLGLALGMGTSGVAVGDKPALDEFRDTNALNEAIAQHPRVLEALDQMKEEKRDLKSHEVIERNCALRELVFASEKKNQWDGQGRWLGSENEEMRYGKILTPQQFYDQLGKVTGKGRFKLSENIVFPSDHRRSGLSGIFMRNPRYDGQAASTRAERRNEALAVADECQKKWKLATAFAKRGRIIEAQKITREVAAMAEDAHKVFDQVMTQESDCEPEFVRVATVQWPLSTEWMIVDFTEFGTVWKPRYYGWRTALLTMIRCGAITEAQAHKAFPVGSGEASDWYLQQVYNFHLEGAIQ